MEAPVFVSHDDYVRVIYEASSPLPVTTLAELCAFNRINALSTIYAAARGWIGACMSAAEIMTALYFDVARVGGDMSTGEFDHVILGKGHAAAMQYACLAGAGILDVDELRRYKHADGPQAHADIVTPGVSINTGSLGQALSKACGIALARPSVHVFVLLGDGELQEGQCFEALQTLSARRIANLTAIIDLNCIQSDSMVSDIKHIPDLNAVLSGLGLSARDIDGNDIACVATALRACRESDDPEVVIARTSKGAGISFMSCTSCERRAYHWHGTAPDDAHYLAALSELRGSLTDQPVGRRIDAILSSRASSSTPAQPAAPRIPGTGAAFGDALVRLAGRHPEIVAFDADLEKPCNLRAFAEAFPSRFFEMGISEQDMTSCAGGFARAGRVPVVNTYASFFRRAFEQVYVNATERSRIVYAGHYAGLDYEPDGRTHQCTGDIAMMRSIPGMTVLYPAWNEAVEPMLHWACTEARGPTYIRLHRRAAGDRESGRIPDHCSFRPSRLVHASRVPGARHAVLAAGPHVTSRCMRIAPHLRFDVWVLQCFTALDRADLEALGAYRRLTVVEEMSPEGGLAEFILGQYAANPDLDIPRIDHIAASGLTHSTLQTDGLYATFGLDESSLRTRLSEPDSE